MKTIKNKISSSCLRISLLTFLLVFSLNIQGQSIRKSWEEFTTQERLAYVNAINSLTKSQVQNLASEHDRLSDQGIHRVEAFLPWHRVFLEFFEGLLKNIDEDLNIPYWNWHESWNSNSLLFQNSNGVNNGLLGYDVDGSIWVWGVGVNERKFNRSFLGRSQPNDNYKNATNLTSFNNSLRVGAHNFGHQFIGGDMREPYSPIDPVFYIHHGMVDKSWADWYNENPNAVVSILDTTMATFNGYNTDFINAQNIVNPRDTKTWYADDNLVTLDNYNASGNERYKYTTGNIVATNFVIPNSADVDFIAASNNSINLKPGFHAQIGSSFVATIENTASKTIQTEPLFVSTDTGKVKANFNESLSLKIKVFPNPATEFFTITNGRGIVSYQLYNVFGSIIEYKEVNDRSINVNVQNLPAGVYILRVLSLYGEVVTKKIIKN